MTESTTSATSLGRVRGTGTGGEPTEYWVHQRVTALSNLALMLWLIASLATLPVSDHGAMRAWVASPLVAVPLILLIVSVFWHFRLGLQVLIEDYVHDPALRALTLALISFFAIGGGVFGIYSVLRVALGAV